MGHLKADLGAFSDGEQAFVAVHGALTETLAQLDQDLRAGLARWNGDAAEAYWNAHAQWQATAQDMRKALTWLHHVLTTAHGNYGNAAQATHTMWSQ